MKRKTREKLKIAFAIFIIIIFIVGLLPTIFFYMRSGKIVFKISGNKRI